MLSNTRKLFKVKFFLVLSVPQKFFIFLVFCKVKKLVDYWQYFSNFFGYSTLVNNGFGGDTRLSEVEK